MNRFQLKTPVAFFIFNREDLTQKVFKEIAKAKPPKLLVIGDGPRHNRSDEYELVKKTRQVITQVDWSCEVITNYAKKNLGCKYRVSSGLDWVFNQVDQAIILEDDCIPNPTFFRFCEEMLDRHRENKNIGMVGGFNHQGGIKRGNADYYYSKYMHIWGWATWRDRWQEAYDVEISDWPDFKKSELFKKITSNKAQYRYWSIVFSRLFLGKIDTWDYQWVYANWKYERLSIIPNINLISNIGAGEAATHTKVKSDIFELPTFDLEFPLVHPIAIKPDFLADFYTASHSYNLGIKSVIIELIKSILLIMGININSKYFKN
jgi:hypothetical protein